MTARIEPSLLGRMSERRVLRVLQTRGPLSRAEVARHADLSAPAVSRAVANLLRAGLTIGISIYPNDGADAATLVANADAALYRAKAEARGSIRFFEPDMDRRLREKRALQHDMRSALARDEMELYYQPQALVSGEMDLRYSSGTDD